MHWCRAKIHIYTVLYHKRANREVNEKKKIAENVCWSTGAFSWPLIPKLRPPPPSFPKFLDPPLHGIQISYGTTQWSNKLYFTNLFILSWHDGFSSWHSSHGALLLAEHKEVNIIMRKKVHIKLHGVNKPTCTHLLIHQLITLYF